MWARAAGAQASEWELRRPGERSTTHDNARTKTANLLVVGRFFRQPHTEKKVRKQNAHAIMQNGLPLPAPPLLLRKYYPTTSADPHKQAATTTKKKHARTRVYSLHPKNIYVTGESSAIPPVLSSNQTAAAQKKTK